ncbi:hypothetical protein V5799_012402 [Amblyomma americanum]|uniref:Uncharacterized protein n=1 Tax=Amblyomma americanum TaxID=6943 RepID=A0AAQ4EE72_AMBAM
MISEFLDTIFVLFMASCQTSNHSCTLFVLFAIVLSSIIKTGIQPGLCLPFFSLVFHFVCAVLGICS